MAETILIVEDDEALRSTLATLLEEEGFDVGVAADAVEALKTIRERQLDVGLVLSDVSLPFMNGIDLAERVREYCPDARTLLISGYPLRELSGFHEGVEFIEKPFTSLFLIRKIRKLLRNGATTEVFPRVR